MSKYERVSECVTRAGGRVLLTTNSPRQPWHQRLHAGTHKTRERGPTKVASILVHFDWKETKDSNLTRHAHRVRHRRILHMSLLAFIPL